MIIIEARLEENVIIDDVLLFEPRHHDSEVGKELVAGKALVNTGKFRSFSYMNYFPKRELPLVIVLPCLWSYEVY